MCYNIQLETRPLSRRQPTSKYTSMMATIERANALALNIKWQDTTSVVDLDSISESNHETMDNFCRSGLHEMVVSGA